MKALSRLEQQRLVEWIKVLVDVPGFKGWVNCPEEIHEALKKEKVDGDMNPPDDPEPGELLFMDFDADPHEDQHRFSVSATFYTGNKAAIGGLGYDTRSDSGAASEVEKLLEGNLEFKGTWKQVLTRLRKISRIIERVWNREGEHSKICVPFPPKK